jgi:antitoxin component of RelBE/YafQ-DinJ toxin-antitoxin module
MALKAMLKKEPFFSPANTSLLYSYFFLREFISEIIKLDNNNDIVIVGSNSFPAYSSPFRIPTDLDIETPDKEKTFQLIQDTISTINNKNDKFNFNISAKIKNTSNDVLQFRTDAKFLDLKSSFFVDIVPNPSDINKQKMLLNKIISTDEEFYIPVQPIETAISKKVLSILEKLDEKGRSFYRTKDFYDIFKLMKGKNISHKSINKALNNEVCKHIFKNPKYERLNLANTRKNLPRLTENFEVLWGKMKNHFKVDSGINPIEVRKFGLDLISELEM